MVGISGVECHCIVGDTACYTTFYLWSSVVLPAPSLHIYSDTDTYTFITDAGNCCDAILMVMEW